MGCTQLRKDRRPAPVTSGHKPPKAAVEAKGLCGPSINPCLGRDLFQVDATLVLGGQRIEVDRALSATFRSDEIFDEIEAAMGPFEMSGLTALIYALVALPE